MAAAAVTVDPDPCNSLTEGPGGLLVPATALEGVAPGTEVGTGRSVNVDVVAPAGTDCPQEWQVGARLTPVFDEQYLETFVDLAASPSGEWVATPLTIALPEAGVYEISATLQTVISTNPSSGNYGIAILGRLFNVTVGGAVFRTQYTAQHNKDNNPSTSKSDADLSTFHRFLTVPGLTVIRLEVALVGANGTPVATTGLQAGNTRLAFKKISD
ncbi:hypothetical protein ACFYNV_29780 [Streptomyces albidoflavus]